MVLFSMFGTLMFCSKLLMELLPNIHLLGMFIMVFTVVFRLKALLPIYIFVMLTGVYAGFAPWWIPYIYIWAVLWGVTMLLPRKMPRAVAAVVYPILCGLHGLGFGLLYAPAQAVMFGLNFEGAVAWFLAGLPFDALHGLGNLLSGVLILPLVELLRRVLPKNIV